MSTVTRQNKRKQASAVAATGSLEIKRPKSSAPLTSTQSLLEDKPSDDCNDSEVFADSLDYRESQHISEFASPLSSPAMDSTGRSVPAETQGESQPGYDHAHIPYDSDDAENNGGNTFPVVPPNQEERRTTSQNPTAPTLADMSKLLDKKLERFADREYISAVVQKVDNNAEKIHQINKRLDELSDPRYNEDRIMRTITSFWDEKIKSNPPSSVGYPTGARNAEQDAARREKYQKSRRFNM